MLPDTASEKPQEGSVLAVGPGRVLDNGKRVEMEVKDGDTVLFAKYAGTEVKLDGEDYLVIRESDLLAIIDQRHRSSQTEDDTCPLKISFSTPRRADSSRSASTPSPTPSRSPSARAAATWPSTRSGARPPSPTTA